MTVALHSPMHRCHVVADAVDLHLMRMSGRLWRHESHVGLSGIHAGHVICRGRGPVGIEM